MINIINIEAYLLVVYVLYNMRRLLTHSCLKLTCDPSRILQGPSPFQTVQNIQHFIARHNTSSPVEPPDNTDSLHATSLLHLTWWMTSQICFSLWTWFLRRIFASLTNRFHLYNSFREESYGLGTAVMFSNSLGNWGQFALENNWNWLGRRQFGMLLNRPEM